MSVQYASQGVQAGQAAITAYHEMAHALDAERTRVGADLDGVRQSLTAAIGDVVHALLPDAAPATLRRAAELAPDPALLTLPAEAEAATAARAARLRALAADPDYAPRGGPPAVLRSTPRMADIEHRAEYRDRVALADPRLGTLSTEIEEHTGHLEALDAQVGAYEASADFQRERDHAARPAPGPLARVVRVVCLYGLIQDHRRARRVARLLAQFHHTRLSDAFHAYESAVAARDTLRDARSVLVARREAVHELEREHVRLAAAERARLDGLAAEHEALEHEQAVGPERLLRALRASLAAWIGRSETLEAVRGRTQPGETAVREGLTTVTVLRAKATYLSQMRDHLSAELQDRQRRAQAVAAVVAKWSRRPGRALRKDATPWLVDGPARLRQSTTQTVQRVDTMRSGVVGFTDYLLYSTLLDSYAAAHDQPVLPYDVFARCAPVRMPGDGFAQQVLGDVQEYRASCGRMDPRVIDAAQDPTALQGDADRAAAEAALADTVGLSDAAAGLGDLDGVEESGPEGLDDDLSDDGTSDPGGMEDLS